MSTTRMQTELTCDAIWAVLANPHSYADWVVGAKEVRSVTGNWPQPPARIHHTVGAGTLENTDDTVALEASAPRHLKIKAHFRPLGVAEVTIDLEDNEGGAHIIMEEVMIDGAASHIPQAINDVGLHPRNVKSLERLVELAKLSR